MNISGVWNVCHKILRHRETVKFSILKKDLIFFKKSRTVFNEMWEPLSKQSLFDDLKVN